MERVKRLCLHSRDLHQICIGMGPPSEHASKSLKNWMRADHRRQSGSSSELTFAPIAFGSPQFKVFSIRLS